MQHHEEFVTEDFQRYVDECRHMASLARRAPGTTSRGAATPARWTDWADRLKSFYA